MINGNVANSEAEFLLEEENKWNCKLSKTENV
jgi:hypothetical protein